MTYLRPHQKAAVEAALARFDAGEPRVHDVLACGTGKTRIGRAVADGLLDHDGQVLVAAPRINLLVQAVAEYRVAGEAGLGHVVMVCSDRAVTSDTRLRGLDLTVTTSASHVAALAQRSRRLTVFVTYGSVPTVIEAHAQGLAPWDLVVADEAHYLVGQGPWARIHDDACVPARRRRYTTATPRILTPRADGGGTALTGDMADVNTFGTRAYELSFADAIDHGLLAPFRVVTPVITHGQVRQLVDRAHHLTMRRGAVSADVAAVQVAALKAMVEFDAQRALTFHSRVQHARMWATSLPHIPDLLPQWNGTVWAHHLNGAHSGRTRAHVLDAFAAPADHTTKRFLTNVALFRDGFDAPGCDTVVLTHPITSLTLAVQMFSRALRPDPHRPDKTATFILPVLLSDHDRGQHALESPAWSVVWSTLRALASMHTDLFDQARQDLRAHGAARPEEDHAPPRRVPAWWHVRGVPVPDEFAAAIGLRAMRTLAPAEEEYFGALDQFHADFGHLRVPINYVTPGGLDLGRWVLNAAARYRRGVRDRTITRLLDMGMTLHSTRTPRQDLIRAAVEFYHTYGHLNVPFTWVTSQGLKLGHFINVIRQEHKNNKLSQSTIDYWESMNIVWSPVADQERAARQAALDYYATHGELLVHGEFVTHDGIRLGRKIAQKRKENEEGTITNEEFAFYDSLNMWWDRKQAQREIQRRHKQQRWERAYRFAEQFYARNGHLHVPPQEKPTDEHGSFGLYDWLRRQHHHWDQLATDQQKRLLALGFVPPPQPHCPRAEP